MDKLKRKINNAISGQWTVRDNRTKKDICTFDTLLSYDFKADSNLPTYPIQSGSFENYNKTFNPNVAKVSLAISGSKKDIHKELIKIEDYNETTRLVDLILPYRYFIGYNLHNLSHYKSEGDAVGMLVVSFDLVEIRQVVVNFAYTTSDNKTTKNNGKVNTQQGKSTSILKKVFG